MPHVWQSGIAFDTLGNLRSLHHAVLCCAVLLCHVGCVIYRAGLLRSLSAVANSLAALQTQTQVLSYKPPKAQGQDPAERVSKQHLKASAF